LAARQNYLWGAFSEYSDVVCHVWVFDHDHGVFAGSAEWYSVFLIFKSVIHHIGNRIACVLEPFQEANFGAIAFRFVLGVFIEFHVGLIVVEDVFYQYVFVCLVFFEHIPERVASFADSNSLLLH
jgi:hypothetical protein